MVVPQHDKKLSNRASQDEGVPHIRVTVERPVLSQEIFHDVSEYEKPPKEGIFERLKKSCQCDGVEVLRKTVPIVDWLPRYDWSNDLPCDIIAGVTVAIMQIPQGLGYALLANVPAIVGIYMAVFPVIPYILLGTSRHNSMGTFAVISLLVGRAVTQYANNPEFTYSMASENGTVVETEYSVVEVGTSLTILVAGWHLLMYFLRMGSICALLSDVFVNSFTCGAGIHIFTSQVKSILGVSTQRYSGPFQLLKTYREMIVNLIDGDEHAQITTAAAVSVSSVCIVSLLFSAYVIKPQLAKITRIPFPCELLLVVGGVLLSDYFDLPGLYGLAPIGEIPKGLPEPTLPRLGLTSHLLADSFIAAVVSYATLMSMALILAKGEDYQVDANQELLAMGVGNLVGSFFSCIAFAASLSRSIVGKGVGGRTQLTALVSMLIIILTLLWVADFFEPLPRAVLASIIVVALRSVLLQVFDLPAFWRLSKTDGMLWICVFLSVVVIDIDYGLLIGFTLSAAKVFMQGLKAYTCLLGNVPNTDLYLDIKRYKAAFEIPGFKIIHYCGPLNFATRQNLHDTITKLSGVSPQVEQRKRSKQKNGDEIDINGKVNLGFEDGQFEGPGTLNKVEMIILDMSAVSGLDPSSAIKLHEIKEEYKDIGIIFIITGCSGPVYEQLRKCGLLSKENALQIFPSVHDAVRIYLNDN